MASCSWLVEWMDIIEDLFVVCVMSNQSLFERGQWCNIAAEGKRRRSGQVSDARASESA